MAAEWWALLVTAAGMGFGLVWGAARISSTTERLDRTLDKLADALAVESRSNAVQDTRLDGLDERLVDQGRRLDGHDERFNRMERGR